MTEQEKYIFIRGLEKFIKDEEESVISFGNLIPINEIDKILQEVGYKELDMGDDFSTNGWQVDFWCTFRAKKREDKLPTLVYAGSLYYGGADLTKGEDEEDDY